MKKNINQQRIPLVWTDHCINDIIYDQNKKMSGDESQDDAGFQQKKKSSWFLINNRRFCKQFPQS